MEQLDQVAVGIADQRPTSGTDKLITSLNRMPARRSAARQPRVVAADACEAAGQRREHGFWHPQACGLGLAVVEENDAGQATLRS